VPSLREHCAHEEDDEMIPALPAPDSTIDLMRDGYLFGSRRFERVGGDAFRTRLLGRRVVVIRGKDAARFFYEDGRFERSPRAMPASIRHLLQDDGSVQSLTGAMHERRKHLFIEMFGVEARRRLTAEFDRQWSAALERWRSAGRIVLLDEVTELLGRAVFAWAGIPADQHEAERIRAIDAMVAGAGRFGPANWRARRVRSEIEEWAAGLIARVRAGVLDPPADAALRRLADHRDADGSRMTTSIAAVELLNVLRPVIAVGRFIVFVAAALQAHPHWRGDLRLAPRERLEAFVNEVRRYYPFFPMIGGTATRDLEWRDTRLPEGSWVLLDLYGTDHDGALWPDPERFQPERFAARPPEANALVPQGGGEYATGHRCAGEPATIDLMADATRKLISLDYDVPPQDARISLRRYPAQPESGFVIDLA
jgi:fatty-acid peroxygenase